eukprot:CAMPEP_0113567926 /NCGR_PEP_ID=MMETSP0015_2-20120614/23551_1 /TAXON_ID=2838 /ORGANISM="Odontella" /LENGTH=1316 /DNA_ID=CAMNT_0000470383 /DNA_START=161 /DNA_END=4111 /DNA_ORIENTATION=+ /assembly_acc=CAM_ASM_000160
MAARVDGGSGDGDDLATFTQIPLGRVSEILSPFLTCHSGHLRNADSTYAGRWDWMPRVFFIVGRTHQGSRRMEQLRRHIDGPVLLMYDLDGGNVDDNVPSGVVRLVPQQRSTDEACSHISVVRVPLHPKHVEIQVTANFENIYVGGSDDKPRRKRRKNVRHEPGDIYAWRLRLRDDEEASCWFDALSQALSEDPTLTEDRVDDMQPILTENSTSIDNSESNDSEEHTQPPLSQNSSPSLSHSYNHVTGGAGEGQRGRSAIPNRAPALKYYHYIFFISIIVIWTFAMGRLIMDHFNSSGEAPYHDGVVHDTCAGSTTMPNISTSSGPHAVETTKGIDSSFGESEDEKDTNPASDRSITRVLSLSISRLLGTLRSAFKETTKPSVAERPPLEETLLRNTLAMLESFRALKTYAQESFVVEYVWIALPSLLILVLSIASIFSNAFPRVGIALWDSRIWCVVIILVVIGVTIGMDAHSNYLRHSLEFGLLWDSRIWCVVIILVVIGVTIGMDAYSNYLRHSLEFGLYWEGYARVILSAGCLFSSNVFRKKALGRRPRHRMSAARKASAGLSAGVAILSLPLALRSIQDGRFLGSPSSRIYATSSFLSFFVGMYFLGRAIRHLSVAGIEVGEFIHGSSLLPARSLYFVLGVAGDALHFVLLQSGEIFLTLYKAFSPLRKAIIKVADEIVCLSSKCLSLLWNTQEWVAQLIATVSGRLGKLATAVLMRCRQGCRVVNHKFRSGFMIFRSKAIDPVVQILYLATKVFLGKTKDLWQGYILPAVRSAVYLIVKLVRKATKSINDQIVFPLFRLMRRIMALTVDTLFCLGEMLVHSVKALLHFFGKMFRRILSCVLHCVLLPLFEQCANALNRGLYILSNVISICLRQFIAICKALHSVISHFISQYFRPATAAMYTMCMVGVCSFTKKYWRLGASVISLHVSHQFALSAIAAPVCAQTQYALGAWALMLVGYSVAAAVLSADGRLVPQYVTIRNSALWHIDMHLGYFVYHTLSSGWQALSTGLKLLLHSIDIVIRQTFTKAWKIGEVLHKRGTKPLINAFSSGLRLVWDSPHFSMIASLFTLSLLYLHHAGVITRIIPGIPWSLATNLLVEIPAKASGLCNDILKQSRNVIPIKPVRFFFSSVYSPLIEVEGTSPSVALTCWAFVAVVKLTQNRIRTKTLALPVVFMYLMEATGLVLFRAFAVSCAIWLVLQVLVHNYETEQRELARTEFDSFQRDRPSSVPSAPVEIEGADPKLLRGEPLDRDECCICLDTFDSTTRSEVELPCGHHFHEICISDWLKSSVQKRRPLCRRATGGWDRVLEVVF